jgi:hypothetical protein
VTQALPGRALPARFSWLRALPSLVRAVVQTMPWVTLITGCLAGAAYLVVMGYVADTSRSPLTQGSVRLAFVPVVAALAFVPRVPFRPLTQTTPVPAWVPMAGQLLLGAPVIAATYWAQLRIMIHTIPPDAVAQAPAVCPLAAQLAGWCMVTVAAAACVDRSRFADVGGGAAVPVSAAVIALAWYVPVTHRLLADPPATAHGVTLAWYCVAVAAAAVTTIAMLDRWRRYGSRLGRRLSAPQRIGIR